MSRLTVAFPSRVPSWLAATRAATNDQLSRVIEAIFGEVEEKPPELDSLAGAKAGHTFVVSDIHLSDAQEIDSRRPLWKRFKGRDLFVDDSFARFLEHVGELADGEGDLELILNGDIFDFDSVMAIPEDPPFRVRWLEKKRGLDPEEEKTVYKMSRILADHPVFVGALHNFLLEGNRVIFVIGNHDMELHWPAAQEKIRQALDLPDEMQTKVRFCSWFYVSGGDTLVEHGNQYDSYCVCADPVRPLVHVRNTDRVRLPFGNLACKYMLNGMGLFNPHVDSSFILSLKEYLRFFFRYLLRIQPLLVWTWFWTAVVTLVVSLRQGFLPAVRDPFTLEDRVESIARRANATPRIVRGLRALRVHPAVFNPVQVARELWLDRALLLGLVIFGTFQLFSMLNVFVELKLWWWLLFFVVLLPPFTFYARKINSDVDNIDRNLYRLLPEAARLLNVRRAILGHTHQEEHTELQGVDLLNTGTWSPAYTDVECTVPLGRKCFAWLRPGPEGRSAELREWMDPGSEILPREP
jgi:UDP-2,3-diacylglucosamine pyrophosphatase LpxH